MVRSARSSCLCCGSILVVWQFSLAERSTRNWSKAPEDHDDSGSYANYSAPDISGNPTQDCFCRPAFTSVIAGWTSTKKDRKSRYRESKSKPVQASPKEAVAIEIDSTWAFR